MGEMTNLFEIKDWLGVDENSIIRGLNMKSDFFDYLPDGKKFSFWDCETDLQGPTMYQRPHTRMTGIPVQRRRLSLP